MEGKKVLVVGGGGRCHAIVDALVRSPQVAQVFCAPGNAGIGLTATNVPIKDTDVSALLAGEEKTIVVNAKLADGSFTYQPAFPVEGASTGSVISRENLKKLGDSDK